MTIEKLKPLSKYNKPAGPLVLVVMDGVGIGPQDESDGIKMAFTPVLDDLKNEKLATKLKAHGTAVGLPSDGDMGNSEVGHNALGAGRVISQGAKLINDAFESGKIFESSSWLSIRETAQKGGTIHLLGMLSDGNVHSNIEHLYLLLDQCVKEDFKNVRVHALLDGRDVGAKSALDYFIPLEEKLADVSNNGKDYRIASGGGRMVTTMDRYGADWSIVEKGWQTHVLGEGRQFSSAVEAIKIYYAEDSKITDQYMDSFVIAENDEPVGRIESGDGVILFNFRGDRAIEISRAFDEEEFTEFDRQRYPKVFFTGLMQYDGDANIPQNFLVEPPVVEKTLGEYLATTGVTSFAISETQKFGHMTYFWNGNKSGYIDDTLEKYVEIPSDKLNFDLRPWMKAAEITDEVIAEIESGEYRFIRLNYANSDMVGHTGNEAAVRIAVETVDINLGRLLEAVEKAEGMVVITADHGNADNLNSVAHTKNPVPFIIVDYANKNDFQMQELKNPGLANVAATVCNLLGYEAPEDYEKSLIRL